ncbi:hypothetical protein GCM10009715_08880 [Paeniglutamicibacter psychrophenolicus]
MLASVGQVDASPRKRPKSSYVPFVRSTAMSLWQLDAFEYRLPNGKTKTIYQLIDDATRYDVGTLAYARHENSPLACDPTFGMTAASTAGQFLRTYLPRSSGQPCGWDRRSIADRSHAPRTLKKGPPANNK